MALVEWDDLLASLAVESSGDDHYTAPNIPMPEAATSSIAADRA